MKTKVTSLIAMLFLLFCYSTAYSEESNLPEPTVSKYLTTKMAAFLINYEKGNLNYVLEFEASRTPLYLATEFEDPTGEGSKIVYSKILKGKKVVEVESPPFDNAQNLKKYRTTTKIYSDAKHSQLIDEHVQYVLFQIPPR